MPFCLEPAHVKRRVHRQISAISIDRICGGGHRAVPDEELEGLMRSIRRLGLLMPLLVRPRGDGYELIAGARRLAACRALGMDEVECIVMPALEEECLLAALAENACRAAPAAADTEALRRALNERHGYTRAELDELCPTEGASADGIDRAGGAAAAPEGLDLPDCAAAPEGFALPDNADARAPHPQGCLEEPPCALPGEGAYAGRAEARPARRDTHGYIRDERLIVNAMANVVDELKRAGVEASMDVSEAEDRVNVHVSCPRISAFKCRHAPPAKGEHSVEFLKNIGESAEKCAMQIEKHGGADAESSLALSEIGRALREKDAAKFGENAGVCGASAREIAAAVPRAAHGDMGDLRYFPRRAARRGMAQERSCAAEDESRMDAAAKPAGHIAPQCRQGAAQEQLCAADGLLSALAPMEEVAPQRGRNSVVHEQPRTSAQAEDAPPRRGQGAAHEQFCAARDESRASVQTEDAPPRRGQGAAQELLCAADGATQAAAQTEDAPPRREQGAAQELLCAANAAPRASAQTDDAPPRREQGAATHEHTSAPDGAPRVSAHPQDASVQPRPRTACAPDDPPAHAPRAPMSAAEYVERMLREEQARIRRSHILT